jgi:hypothetical protein
LQKKLPLLEEVMVVRRTAQVAMAELGRWQSESGEWE